MGCGASNSNSATANSSNNRPSRPANTTTVPVRSNNAVGKPLVKPKNYKHGTNISQRDITNMRQEFWATRTEGNVHMWQGIRSAAEAILSNDVPLANAILDATNIISPSGTMEVLYDERGAQYKVPIYCYAHPVELCGESPTGAALNTAPVSNEAENKGNNANNPPIANAVPVPTASVARNVTKASGDPIQVKIRINPGDITLVVNAETSFSILELKQCIVEQSIQAAIPVTDMKEDRQRIIFMGRELQNTQKLSEVGFDNQKVVQVFLRPQKK